MGKHERLSAEKAEREWEREARKRARENEEAAAARKRWRRWAWTAAWLLAIVVFVVAAVFALAHSWGKRERVTGRLVGVRDLSFTPSTQASGGISPVCGCLKPPFNAWRGVTFAGREAILTRRGRSPLTEWTISGAEAKEGIEPVPASQRVAVEVVQMNPAGRFDPSWMIDGELAEHGKILSRRVFNAFLLSIITNGDLHVGMLGDVPVGAWIPLPRSEVELTAEPSPFPGTRAVPRLTERHPPGRSMDRVREAHGRIRGQGYPIGDFLGPNLVLWSGAPFTEVSGWPIERGQRGAGLVTAVRLKGATFSTRVGAVPLTRREFGEHLPFMLAAPHGGREYVYSGRPDGSEIVVRVTKPLGERSYARLRQRVLAHPVIHMRPFNRIGLVLPANRTEPWHGLLAPPVLNVHSLQAGRARQRSHRNIVHEVIPIPERDRYPPLPREAGFNVFGPLHSILFRGVRGHLLLADQEKNLSGSADLRLTDVSGLRNEAGEELVPAPLSTSGDSATLQLRAVGEASINGVPQTVTSFMEEHGNVLAALSFALALLSAALGVYAFARARGRTARSSAAG
jgi:hypothetical protein